MTATFTSSAGSRLGQRGNGTVRAAIQFIEHGWPVLPGSVFDGRRYVVPSTRRPTGCLQPLVPIDQASVEVRTVANWWRMQTSLVPSVLIVTGPMFDAVAVSRDLAVEAVQTDAFRDVPGPVIMRADEGRAYFLLRCGERVPPPEDARPTVVEAVPSGRWLAAPPTRTAVGGVSWLASPQGAGWAPVEAAVLSEALHIALPRTATARWGG